MSARRTTTPAAAMRQAMAERNALRQLDFYEGMPQAERTRLHLEGIKHWQPWTRPPNRQSTLFLDRDGAVSAVSPEAAW